MSTLNNKTKFLFLIASFFICGCSAYSNVSFKQPVSPVQVPTTGPATLAYVVPSYYKKGTTMTPVTPTMTGTATQISVSPALPAGLTIDATTGIISGTPSVALPASIYTISGVASDGSAVTTTISFEIALDYAVNSTTNSGDLTPGDQLCANASAVCTLRAALEEAAANPTLLTVITLPSGIFTPTTTLYINSRVRLVGDSSVGTLINGANSLKKILNIGSYAVTLDNLSVKNGSNTTDSTINGVAIESTSPDLTLSNCAISNNVVNTNFASTTIQGIGVYSKSLSPTSQVRVDACSFTSNSLSLGFNTSAGSISGGALFLQAGAVTFINTSLTSNQSIFGNVGTFSSRGLGVYANSSTFSVENSSVSGNVAQTNSPYNRGGGIYLQAGVNATMNRLVCDQNTADQGGGCLWHEGGVLTLTNSSIIKNIDSTNSGGGITLDGASVASISSSYFETGSGGTTLLQAAPTAVLSVSIKNSTFQTQVASPAIQINATAAGSVAIENCTLRTSGLGNAYAKSANTPVVTIKNSILENTAGGAVCGGDMATTATGGYNISHDASCSFLSGASGDLQSVDPLLSAPAVNGGFTKSTAIAAGSPARDLVPLISCLLTVDQRGTVRPQGGACDAGAYEY